MTEKERENREKEKIRRLARLLGTEPAEPACQACLEQLDAYVEAQMAGEDYVARFAQVAHHLDVCQECTQAYALLYELAFADANDQLPQPARIPEPDLGFLEKTTATAAAADLIALLRQSLQRTGQKLTLQLTAELLPHLQPQPGLAVTRSAADSDRYGQPILELVPENVPDLAPPVTIMAYGDRQQPDRCLVEVTVEPPGQSWPDLAGKQVVLTVADGEQTAVTDDWGVAAFAGVPVAELDTMRLDIDLGPVSGSQ